MSRNLRVDERDMQHVWSKKRGKFVRVDDELRSGCRQFASLLAFIKHKFHEEFEDFVEGCDVSGVDVFSDILLPSSSVDIQEEEEDDEGVSGNIFPSNEDTKIETRQSKQAVKNVEQRHSNVSLGKSGASNPVVSSQTPANSKKPLERMPKAATLEIPSTSSSAIRFPGLQKKQQLEKESDRQNSNRRLSNRRRSLKSKVPSKELPKALERKQPVKQSDTEKRLKSNRSFQKVGKSEGNCADSLAPAGNSVDSGPSENSRETGGKKKNGKIAVPTRRTKLGKTERQQTRVASTSDLKCPICKKTYSTRSNLKMHKLIHNPEKKFHCLLCPKSFHQKFGLESHQLTHGNVKQFKCSFCPKTFRHSSTRRGHEMIHRNLKPFKCPFCAKCFRQSNHLRHHKLRHSNEKRYRCCVCTKAFRTASQLSRHERIHRFE